MSNGKAAKAAPQTPAQRQAAFRARRAMLDASAEVRGIYLPAEHHAALKEYARKLALKK